MFEELEARRRRLDAHRPLSADVQRRLDDLFRPWFIFSSNAIEGNTLTLGDTIYLLQKGILPAGKREEEYLEVKGQDVAYAYLQDAVRGGFLLSEKLVRELHTLLTEKLETEKYGPGRYKTRDNLVRLADGTLFPYVPAIDTPAAMQELIAWYSGPAQALHPIERAARLHYKFILIHPFLDGNGRTARLLANLALLQAEYLVVVFRAQDSERRLVYLDALRAVDTSVLIGDLRPDNEAVNVFPFVTYLEQELLWSYDQALDVIEGRLALTPEDLVRRFEGMERRVLEAKGIAGDDVAQIALRGERVEQLVNRVAHDVAPMAKELGARWNELEIETETTTAPVSQALGYLFYRGKALGIDDRSAHGRIGVIILDVKRRRTSSAAISVPLSRCEFIVMAEPHRMILAGVFVADWEASWESERLYLPLDPAGWSASIEMFVARVIQRFLEQLETALRSP